MAQELMREMAAPETLHQAWRTVRRNRGESRIDAADLERFERDLPASLERLGRELRTETYLPPGLRRATLPKPDGTQRELRIPAIEDRIAQRACLDVLTPRFEKIFLPCSFGYRPGRGVADAVRQVRDYRAAGWNWILDADVQNFFGSVQHTELVAQLETYISDRATLRLIRLWLEAGALQPGVPAGFPASALRETISRPFSLAPDSEDDWEEDSDAPCPVDKSLAARLGMEAAGVLWTYRRSLLPFVTRRALMLTGSVGLTAAGVYQAYRWHQRRTIGSEPCGTPQGGPLSPLLANLYLHPFDVRLTRMGLRLVRYADDFVVCCPSEARARFAQTAAARELSRLHLRLHPEKTRLVPRDGAFRFLGHEFDGDGVFPIANDE